LHIKSGLRLTLVGTLFLMTGCNRAGTADYAISHVNIVDAEAGIVRAEATIVLNGKTISQIVASKDFTAPASLRVVDGSGKFVIPGLWDMHMHFRDAKRDLKWHWLVGLLRKRNTYGGDSINPLFRTRYVVETSR